MSLKFWRPGSKPSRPQLSHLLLLWLLFNFACRAATNVPFTPAPTEQLSFEISPPLNFLPSATPSTTPSSTPPPPPSPIPSPASDLISCEGILGFRLLQPPEQSSVLFEHHAQGTFFIFHLEAVNLTSKVIQIYSGDYSLVIPHEDDEMIVKPHKAATNYLYLVRGDNFYQDKIKPSAIWRTYLAFDVPLNISDWKLYLTPGAGNSSPLCQTTLLP